jgi:flagellar protein FliO/FliZ
MTCRPTAVAGLLASVALSTAQAQEAVARSKVNAAPELFSAGYLFQVIGSLLLVFVCLFGVVYLLKRFNRVGGGVSSSLRVLASASVGQREKVVLINVGNEQLLIGVAPGSVRTLHVLPEPLAAEPTQASQAGDFAAILKAANPLGGRS